MVSLTRLNHWLEVCPASFQEFAMDFDLDAFRDLLSTNEETVYEVSYDGGGPGSSGSARVTKCLDAYWSYDDNGEFGGPYDTLGDALFEQHLCFGGVSIDVQCDELSANEIASQLQIEGEPGLGANINGESWVLNKEGELVPEEDAEKEE
jgi:hypothetical protein